MSDLTEKEKKILLTETTGISIAVVVLLITITVFILDIKGDSKANAAAIIEANAQYSSLKTSYIGHTRIVDDKLNSVSSQLGELKGMVKIMLENQRRNSHTTNN